MNLCDLEYCFRNVEVTSRPEITSHHCQRQAGHRELFVKQKETQIPQIVLQSSGLSHTHQFTLRYSSWPADSERSHTNAGPIHLLRSFTLQLLPTSACALSRSDCFVSFAINSSPILKRDRRTYSPVTVLQ
jgi:hypothetical protein